MGLSERNAISTIRSIQNQYASKNNGEFASTFNVLIKNAGLDGEFSGDKPIISGYVYTMKVRKSSTNKPSFYSINAVSVKLDKHYKYTGNINFYFDSNIRKIKMTEENRQANPNDPSI